MRQGLNVRDSKDRIHCLHQPSGVQQVEQVTLLQATS